jgi:hypothetical protein
VAATSGCTVERIARVNVTPFVQATHVGRATVARSPRRFVGVRRVFANDLVDDATGATHALPRRAPDAHGGERRQRMQHRCRSAAASPLGALMRPKLAQGTHDSRSTDSHYLAEETQRWQ